MTNSNQSSTDERLEAAAKLYEARRYDEAFILYRSLAEDGLTACQTLICYMYMEGKGVPVDLGKAFFWCNKAAAGSDPEGKFYLGKVYARSGRWNETVRCYEEAALQNYSPAIYCLARMYYLGKDVAHDKGKALDLMAKASSLGHLVARREFGKMLIRGQKGIFAIPKGIFLLVAWPFVAFRAVRENLYTEKARI